MNDQHFSPSPTFKRGQVGRVCAAAVAEQPGAIVPGVLRLSELVLPEDGPRDVEHLLLEGLDVPAPVVASCAWSKLRAVQLLHRWARGESHVRAAAWLLGATSC